MPIPTPFSRRRSVAARDHRDGWQVPDLDDVRHRLPLHGGAVPDQGEERGRRDRLNLRKDRLHVGSLHRRSAGRREQGNHGFLLL